jgi:hypothetical protein
MIGIAIWRITNSIMLGILGSLIIILVISEIEIKLNKTYGKTNRTKM